MIICDQEFDPIVTDRYVLILIVLDDNLWSL